MSGLSGIQTHDTNIPAGVESLCLNRVATVTGKIIFEM
jgi:hypothetical protein